MYIFPHSYMLARTHTHTPHTKLFVPLSKKYNIDSDLSLKRLKWLNADWEEWYQSPKEMQTYWKWETMLSFLFWPINFIENHVINSFIYSSTNASFTVKLLLLFMHVGWKLFLPPNTIQFENCSAIHFIHSFVRYLFDNSLKYFKAIKWLVSAI